MRILHTSDLHGRYKRLWDHEDFDIWLDTGDFFPNRTRGDDRVENGFQRRWFMWKGLASRIASWLKGRPLLYVPGNHDYVELQTWVSNSHRILPRGLEFMGERWAGFREIPYIAGEWNGECHDFTHLINETFDADPTVLVTHAPPAGILDCRGYGIAPLTSRLTYTPHRIHTHFFGHTHEEGGEERIEMGIRFVNGAEHARIVEI